MLKRENVLYSAILLLLLFTVACAPSTESPTATTADESSAATTSESETNEPAAVEESEEEMASNADASDEAASDEDMEMEEDAMDDSGEEMAEEESHAMTEDAEDEAAMTEEEEMSEETMDSDSEGAMVDDGDIELNRRNTNIEVFTDDDRSPGLKSLTSSWNTNWEMRTITSDELLSGGPPRDGIPPIDDPTFETPASAEAWLAGNEPVISVEINGEARAYPLQIMTWHEIVNDTVGGEPVIVTFCPLCNSAITFSRVVDGEVFDFGTSGLLRKSDLVMWDRQTETLWQQFTGEGLIGDLATVRLEFVPSLLISFDDFREQHPDGQVLSIDTGFNRNYGRNPYVGYDTIGSNPFLFDGVVDGRLAATERVITLAQEDVGEDVAYPLSVLSDAGVINDSRGDSDIVVFHVPGTSSALGAGNIADGEDVGAAGVYNRSIDGQLLTFTSNGDSFTDTETGSTWNIHGVATAGDLEGSRLEPIVHANHFWFAWAAFKPDTVIFTG